MKKLKGTCKGCGRILILERDTKISRHEAPLCQPFSDPEEAEGSLDATEVATAIVFYRGHRFKERYSYASHIADELRRFFAAGQAARVIPVMKKGK